MAILPDGPISSSQGAALVVSGLSSGSQGAKSTNSAVLKAAATALGVSGGTLSVVEPGVFYVDATLILPSNVELKLAKGVTIKLADAANCQMVRNKAAGVVIQADQFVRASNIATVTEPGHSRVAGDQVLISALATDTSFNGLVTVLAATSSTWTYASTGSNGSPTGFADVNPAYNQIAAANFVRASNVVTVTETGHTRRVGDSVFIANLATDTTFNGTCEVSSVTAGVSWTYANTGSNGSPTGTGIVLGDNNITITGPGGFDGNTANQTTSAYNNTSASFGIVIGNAGHVAFRDLSHYSQTKYTKWLFNVTDVTDDNSYYNTISDGIHFEAPADRVKITRQFGNTNDDMVAFTNTNAAAGGSYNGFRSPSGIGNFGVVDCDGLFPDNSSAPALVKYTSYTGYGFKSLRVANMRGSLSASGQSGVAIVDDTASLTGGTLDNLEIDGIHLTGGSTSSRALVLAGVGAIKKVKVSNAKWDSTFLANSFLLISGAATPVTLFEISDINTTFGLNSSQDVFLITGAGAVVTELVADKCYITGSSNSGNFITAQASAVITRAYLSNIIGNSLSNVFRHNGTGSTTDELYLSNVRFISCANGISTYSNCTYYCTNIKATGTVNNTFQVAGGTVRIIGKNMDLTAGKVALFNFNSSVISYNCPDKEAGIDLGNPAASITGQTPIAGDQIWNTNANAAATGLTARTAAGAWTRLF